MMWCVSWSITTCFVLECLPFCSGVVGWEVTAFAVLTSYSCFPVVLSWLILWSECGLRENSPLSFAQRKDKWLTEPRQLPMLKISHEWNNHPANMILTDNWVQWSWGDAITFAGISIWTKGVNKRSTGKIAQTKYDFMHKQILKKKKKWCWFSKLLSSPKWKEGFSGHRQHFLDYSELHPF